MIRPGTILWLARHEARLSWRDWLWLITGGFRRRAITSGIVFLVFMLFLHAVAYVLLGKSADFADTADRHTLVAITGTLLMSSSLMLSQALESVTRGFYARGDLDLILSSPVSAGRLFAVRTMAMAAAVAVQSLLLAAPFVNVLIWRDGPRWLGAYAVTLALAMVAVAFSVGLTVALFRLIGPRRTRTVAQILAAIIGAAFVIAAQFAAILSFGTMSRGAVLQSATLDALVPDGDSLLWWPAQAAMGGEPALGAVLGFGAIVLAVTILAFARHFGPLALAAGGASQRAAGARRRRPARFHDSTPAQALRRKEWTLLQRDPWLMSQTLMQLLYLLPPAFFLWHSFYGGGDASGLLVPVLIMAAGQLGGGLAWLAVSGEDAPDLVATAPVSRVCVLRAKIEAVLGGIAIVFVPFVAALAAFSPLAALAAALGVAISAGSATAIQFWFRTQARRSLFRRRQVSSRLATFAEALSSIGWAGTGALAATGTWLAVIPGMVVLAILGGTWLISPVRAPTPV